MSSRFDGRFDVRPQLPRLELVERPDVVGDEREHQWGNQGGRHAQRGAVYPAGGGGKSSSIVSMAELAPDLFQIPPGFALEWVRSAIYTATGSRELRVAHIGLHGRLTRP